MKILIALIFISATAFARDLDATRALLQVLPAGNYQGTTPEGISCQVSVVPLSDKVAIIASTNSLTKRNEVASGATYRWNPGNRSFLASTLETSYYGTKESIFRTIADTEKTQYVVVSDVTNNNGSFEESKVECVVNL